MTDQETNDIPDGSPLARQWRGRNGTALCTIEFGGDGFLDVGLDLALQGITRAERVNAWQERTDAKGHALVLGYVHSGEPQKPWIRLPTALGAADLLPMVEQWLAGAHYPEEPDTDGTAKRGYVLDNVGALMHSAELLIVRPRWVVYGK